MWGFTRYNVIVQQVEGVSDVLRRVADRIEPLAGADPDHVAPLLVSHLREIVGHLDRRALAIPLAKSADARSSTAGNADAGWRYCPPIYFQVRRRPGGIDAGRDGGRRSRATPKVAIAGAARHDWRGWPGGEIRDPRRGSWVREPVQTSPKLLKPATRKRKRLVI